VTYLGTLQTRMARQDLARARADARLHDQACVTCASAARRRDQDERCAEGQALAAAVPAAAEALAAEVAADRAPAAGQEALW
jgi:hypothetical protein